jgi:hypothetical protein
MNNVTNCFFFLFFMQCAGNLKVSKSKLPPLKMILSKSVGSRYQMDLIEMPPCRDHRYILRVVDHLSMYGFVAPLYQRTSEEVGFALLQIVSRSIVPEILQSDNGSEVSGIVHNVTCPALQCPH